MATSIKDIDGARTLVIDGNSELNPGSVFIEGYGFCYEIDKGIMLNFLRREFGLVPISDVAPNLRAA